MRTLTMLLLLCAGCGGAPLPENDPVMTAGEAMSLPNPAVDHRIPYGSDPLHFGDLRLPEGAGPHPVAVVIHGGCWLAQYDLEYMGGLAASLTEAGLATWSIEYRRIGDEGGGWPGTFVDVGAAADHLPSIADQFNLDLDRVVAVGHSAGGHLALWLAGRARLEADDPLSTESPQLLKGAVALAGIPDLAAFSSPDGCGSAVPDLLGGDPSLSGERIARTSPIEMVPFGIPQTLIIGERDPIVPREQAVAFRNTAGAEGDVVQIIEIEGAGHFELVNPSHRAMEKIRAAVLELIDR